MVLRKSFYAGGYYRKRPAASNIMNVLLEAWNLGLSIGTVTSRIIKVSQTSFETHLYPSTVFIS